MARAATPSPGPMFPPVLVQYLDHPLTRTVQICAKPSKHLRGHTLAFADESEQDVLGANVAVAETLGFLQRQPQNLLRARSERNVAGRRLLTPADDLLHPLSHRLQADPKRLQRPGRKAIAMDQAQQEMLGTDVVVVQHPGLFLRPDHNQPCPVSEPLEHAPPPPFTPHRRYARSQHKPR
jgi:hypothetical protein